ncbi:helix-turn-helix domain-containing protein [Coprococcus sp. AM100_B19A]|uniref:helix-turn-helix domain-containing protein n=1 Tax=Coprococcus sp. AM100_B19A TaxID=2997949 RepID=UPI0022E4C360|nr:helix-turn-helix transcriptional regulator [Coprococcus sp. AM100_B19A]
MLYEKIQEICNSKGITVSGLEKDLGFSNSTIRKWKNSSPSIENLKKVADYFGVTVDYFLEK